MSKKLTLKEVKAAVQQRTDGLVKVTGSGGVSGYYLKNTVTHAVSTGFLLARLSEEALLSRIDAVNNTVGELQMIVCNQIQEDVFDKVPRMRECLDRGEFHELEMLALKAKHAKYQMIRLEAYMRERASKL